MKDYAINKTLSFTAIFITIVATYLLYGFGVDQWRMILVLIIILGYAHFLVGFYYQLKSFLRSQQPKLRYLTFALLTITSILLAFLILKIFSFVTALFIGFVYFLFHGLLNEQTLLFRQSKLMVPLLHLGSLSVFVISLLAYSLPDPTFFFDSQLNFQPIGQFQLVIYFSSILALDEFANIFWGGLALSLLLMFVSWYRSGHTKLALGLTTTMLLVSGLVFWLGAPPYIFMYLLVVGYHFMTWLIFYLKEMHDRGRAAWLKFLKINIFTFSLLSLFGFVFLTDYLKILKPVSEIVFNYQIFVIVTYIHISTSFMNDEWLKRLEAKLYKKLS